MADQRITQLTSLPKAGVAATDVLPIADISASQTKKVTAKDLVDAGLDLIDVNSIDLNKLNQSSTTKLGTTALADDAVTAAKLAHDSSVAVQTTAPSTDNFEGRGYFNSTSGNLQVFNGSAYQQVIVPTAGIGDLQVSTGKLADGAVTTAKVTALGTAAYADSSVTTAKIADGAVTGAKIATDTITATQVAPNAIGASELADDAVDTTAIANLAVTAAKLGNGAVVEAKLGDLAVTNAKIANATIAYGKLNLADGSVPGAKITTDSITATQIAAAAVATSELADTAVTTAKVANLAITTAKIAADAVTSAQIAPDAVGASELANNSVDTAAIVNLAVTEAKLADGAVATAKLANLSVTDAKIAATTITYGKLNLADGSVPGAKIATDSITTTQIAASAVSTSELAGAAVTTAKLADGAVTAAKIAADSITTAQIAPSAVGASELSDNAVDTAAIVNLAVTDAKLSDGAVTEAKLGDLAVTAAKIANTTITYGKLNLADGSVPGAKIAADSISAGQIAASAVNTSELVDAAVTTAKLANGAVTASQIANDTITAAQIAPSAVGASELANNAVGTAAIVDANVTAAKLANGAVTTAKLGDLAVTDAKIAAATISYGKLGLADGSVPGGKLTDATVTSAKLAASAVGTAAVANAAVTTAKVADSAITAAKVATGAITTIKVDAAGLAAAAIATGAITTDKVLDGAITGTKMADDSVTIVQAGTPTGSGDFEGQQWFDTNTSVQYVWDSTAWIRQAAINVINFTDNTPIAFAIAYPDNHTANVTTSLDTQVANTAFLGPATGADAAPTFRAVVPADLPNATASTKGIIQPGTGLAVNAGTLDHTNSVAAGIYTKVTVDAQGHVSAGATLAESDIPSLSASKITSGELPTDRIADDAITGLKLSDYSIAQIGSSLPEAQFTGQLFFNPLDESFFLWDGNVWQPIGISFGQVVFAGTFNAATNLVTTLTTSGAGVYSTIAGSLPAALPAAAVSNENYYFIVTVAGTPSTGNAPLVPLDPPDYIISNGVNYQKVDVSNTIASLQASAVGFSATTDISALNVQSAIEEVSNECRNATNITSGTLAVARGGTNLASYAKGDLIAASAATTLAKRTVGTNGQVLTANSADATGLTWTTPTTGTVTTVSSSTAALTVATATTTPALTVRSATTSLNGIVQLSDSTSTTSSVLAATPTAVKSAYDLAAAALPKAGGVITGALEIGNTGSLVFEGSTNDGNETTLTVADPTADRTITLPNESGTVITTGASGAVTSAMIADNTIVNADINASAAIVDTKLATITTTGKVSNSATTATSANTLSAIVARDGSGNFSAGTITANLTGTASNVTTNANLTGDVTSSGNATSIAAGVIVNADVNNSAAIAYSKLALSGSIVNDDINATAAIAGTKISPNFGSQNVITTGTSTAASLIPTSSSVPSNGVYLPSGNTVGVATNSTERLRIRSDGELFLAANNTTSAVTINQTGTGNALVVEDSTNPDATPFLIDQSGRTVQGHTTALALNGTGGTPTQQMNAAASTLFAAACYSAVNWGNTQAPPGIFLAKARADAVGTYTIVPNNQDLGEVRFAGADGVQFQNAAAIGVEVDGTPSVGIVPGRIVFDTANSSGALTEAMRITSTGAVLVGATAAPTGVADGDIALQNRLVMNAAAANYGQFQRIADVGTTITATTGTIVFKFKNVLAQHRSAFVKINLSGRANNGTPSNSPACEYAFQLHQFNGGPCSINGTTTIFEYTFVRATHFAFADLGSGECTVTLTNPVALAITPAYMVEINTQGGAFGLDAVTIT